MLATLCPTMPISAGDVGNCSSKSSIARFPKKKCEAIVLEQEIRNILIQTDPMSNLWLGFTKK